jgi:hypothetical protein
MRQGANSEISKISVKKMIQAETERPFRAGAMAGKSLIERWVSH